MEREGEAIERERDRKRERVNKVWIEKERE